MVLKGEFNEKWRTDIPILIMTALAKKQTLRGKLYIFENH